LKAIKLILKKHKMKRLYLYKPILVLVLLVSFGTSCTKLDENLYGRLTPENFYQTDAEVLAALAGVYRSMSFTGNGGVAWRLLHLGTDEFVIPARSDARWYDGGVWLEFARHEWTPINNRVQQAWAEVFGAIGSANAILESLENSPRKDNYKAQIAEARAVRAYAYFYAMDFWGNVPIVTVARIDPRNLPKNNTRKEVFDFIVSELNAASQDLPSVKTVNKSAYYPRMTKEAAYAILAITYLNGEVYTGQSYWQQCIEMCDNVINSGAYTLTSNYVDNFVANNQGSSEFIYAISVDPVSNANGNQFALRVLHDSHRFKFGLPFTPQNGFTIHEDAFNRFEDQDVRKSLILHGLQLDPSGKPIKNIAGTADLVLIPHQNIENSAENEGFRLLKWQPDPAWVGNAGNNDVATIRYAEILLIKAEAILRSGGSSADALALVNQVRERSKASKWNSITLNDILNERGRELMYEGTRRRDMIRFGTFFTGTWKYKTTVTPEFRKLLPIPVTELNANPSLTQNQGYQ
jgi:hypothetical protein